jgi:hypothetical protein
MHVIPFCEIFNAEHLGIDHITQRRDAGIDGFIGQVSWVPDQTGTRATVTRGAPFFGSRLTQLTSQIVEKRLIWWAGGMYFDCFLFH